MPSAVDRMSDPPTPPNPPAGGAPPLVGADAPAPAVPTGTKRKAEDPPAVEPKQKGKGKKAAKTAKLPDDASLKWGQGVEEK